MRCRYLGWVETFFKVVYFSKLTLSQSNTMLFTFNITRYIPGAHVGHQIVLKISGQVKRQRYTAKAIEVKIEKSTSTETSYRIPESTIITQCETLIPKRRCHRETAFLQMARCQEKVRLWVSTLQYRTPNYHTASQSLIQSFSRQIVIVTPLCLSYQSRIYLKKDLSWREKIIIRRGSQMIESSFEDIYKPQIKFPITHKQQQQFQRPILTYRIYFTRNSCCSNAKQQTTLCNLCQYIHTKHQAVIVVLP